MRTEFKGWYHPTDEEVDLLWDQGLLVPDANALLAPYRIRVETQDLLFNVLEAYAANLWCPHQAGLEYQQNRLQVIADQLAEYDEILKKLESAKRELLTRRKDHPILDAQRFADLVQRAFAGVERFVRETKDRHPEVLDEDRDEDTVRAKWDVLLEDKVGPALEVDDEWQVNADRRYDAKIPPGYEDRKKDKDARRYGDLILWMELLERVKELQADRGHPVPVLFITDDIKRDWWRSFEGRRLGPDPVLTQELAEAGGSPFWMYSVARFVAVGAERCGWEVPEEEEGDLRSGEDQVEQPGSESDADDQAAEGQLGQGGDAEHPSDR